MPYTVRIVAILKSSKNLLSAIKYVLFLLFFYEIN